MNLPTLSADRLRLAVVGTGIAGQSHLLDAVTNKRIEVMAICSSRKETAASVAADFGIPAAYNDFQSMLNEQELDAIVIATPPNVLAAQTIASLHAGLDVLAEKPLATRQPQLNELDQALKKSGGHLIVAYTRRYRTAWATAREWIAGKLIGELLRIECLWRGPYRERYSSRSLSYRADPLKRVAGVFLDSGSHALDAILYLTGQIGDVVESNIIIDKTSRADVEGTVIILQSGGVKILLEIQDILQEGETKVIRLTGTDGIIEVNNYSARLHANNDSMIEIVDEYRRRPVDDLLEIRNGGCAYGASLKEASETVRSLLRVYTLAKQPIRQAWRRPRAKAWARLNGAC